MHTNSKDKYHNHNHNHNNNNNNNNTSINNCQYNSNNFNNSRDNYGITRSLSKKNLKIIKIHIILIKIL